MDRNWNFMSSNSNYDAHSQGSNFTGFTRLCKGLSVVLVGGYILLQIFPSAASYVALIPARTIPFAWNLITSGYIEQELPGVIISTVGLLFVGKVLEPLWGPREFLKFIFIVNFLTSICVFITAITLYYITTQEIYLYTPISGFHGVLVGLLVGIKQMMPDQGVNVFSAFKIKSKWMPSLVALVSVVASFFVSEAVCYLPTLLFGTYMSWVYLRYFQRIPETGLKGDPSDEFAFSSFFPDFLRPVIDPAASLFDRLLCGMTRSSDEQSGRHSLGGAPLPGSDPIEASRRRERGARALEQRLAVEKTPESTKDHPDNSALRDASENV